MKKQALFVICLLISSILLSGCNVESNSPIKYKRRFEQYLPNETKGAKENVVPQGGVVDLSEGPKLNYDAKVGPRDLNFDIKIVNPY